MPVKMGRDPSNTDKKDVFIIHASAFTLSVLCIFFFTEYIHGFPTILRTNSDYSFEMEMYRVFFVAETDFF